MSKKNKEKRKGKKGKAAIVIQARLGSTRLPKKVIAPLGSTTMLNQIHRRCAATNHTVIVACPHADANEIQDATGIEPHAGPEHDLLKRLTDAARSVNAEYFVRVTADCPFVDPAMIDHMIRVARAIEQPIVTNTYPPRTYPDGLDLECYFTEFLGKGTLYIKDKEDFYTWLLKNLSEQAFRREVLVPPMGDINLTVDTEEDLEYARRVYDMMDEQILHTENLIQMLIAKGEIRYVKNVEEGGGEGGKDVRLGEDSAVGRELQNHTQRQPSSSIILGGQAEKRTRGGIIIP